MRRPAKIWVLVRVSCRRLRGLGREWEKVEETWSERETRRPFVLAEAIWCGVCEDWA